MESLSDWKDWNRQRSTKKSNGIYKELLWINGGKVTSIISTSGSLIRELKKLGDDFITVKVNGIEYVVDSITHEKTHTDSNLTHLCLLCRDGGSGNIKRW